MGGHQHSPVRSALFLGRSYCREPTGPPRAARRLGWKFLVEQSGSRNPLRGGLFQPAAMKGMCEVLQEGFRRPPPSSSWL